MFIFHLVLFFPAYLIYSYYILWFVIQLLKIVA
jgi:hypothetical protein